MAYRVLNVNYPEMEKLYKALFEAGCRSRDLWDQIVSDVEELGETWKGPNHDAFVKYFEERKSSIQWYFMNDLSDEQRSYLLEQAVWVLRALNSYRQLEAECDEKVKSALSGCA